MRDPGRRGPRSLDSRLEEAAPDPLILPAVIAGALIAFALSFDDLVVSSFNYGVGSTTLPIDIYSSIKFGVSPQINAISTLIVAVVAVALFVAWRLGAFRPARASLAVEDARPG